MAECLVMSVFWKFVECSGTPQNRLNRAWLVHLNPTFHRGSGFHPATPWFLDSGAFHIDLKVRTFVGQNRFCLYWGHMTLTWTKLISLSQETGRGRQQQAERLRGFADKQTNKWTLVIVELRSWLKILLCRLAPIYTISH